MTRGQVLQNSRTTLLASIPFNPLKLFEPRNNPGLDRRQAAHIQTHLFFQVHHPHLLRAVGKIQRDFVFNLASGAGR